MIIENFPCSPLATNSLLVACESTKKAILFDPSEGSFQKFKHLLEFHGLVAEAIYLTHSHWDHIIEASFCQKEFNIPLFVHEEDAKNVQDPGSDGLPLMFPIQSATVSEFLKDQKTYKIGDISFEVIHTPGHSPGSVCFFFPMQKILVSGDTLFKGSIGNLSFATASPDDMWESLKKIEKLPSETVVYPGHGPKTKLSQESWLSSAKELFS